jgi:TrmH family RNA methyltransferase
MPAAPTPIASRANPRVKQLRAAFANHTRLSGGLIAIEGEHLLVEALRSGLTLNTVFLSTSRTPPKWLSSSVELIELTAEVFASVTDTQTPQGIAALLVPPAWTLDKTLDQSVLPTAAHRSAETRNPGSPQPLILIAEALQDPGNLGTLIRSAEAFGATAVLTLPGTVSPWNQKAIRASAGSVFRVPVIPITPADLLTLKFRSLHLHAAVADDPRNRQAIPLTSTDLTQPCALLIGNEGAGLSAELLALAHTRITIPTPGNGTGRVESLNAAIAGSLLLYEAARQREAAHQPAPHPTPKPDP